MENLVDTCSLFMLVTLSKWQSHRHTGCFKKYFNHSILSQDVENHNFCSFAVGARKLNSLVNCTPRAIKHFPQDLFTQKQRADGAVLFHILVSAYMFAAFAYICEDYFVPSLEIMSDGKRKTKEIINISFFILVFLQSRSALNYLFQNWIFILFLSAVCDL